MQPYDWAKFLRERVYELHPQVPEEGFTQGGYKLVYNDTRSLVGKACGQPAFRRRLLDLSRLQRHAGRQPEQRGVGQPGI